MKSHRSMMMIKNPYRDEFLSVMERLRGAESTNTIELYRSRAELVARYAFAVPDDRTIAFISACSPLVEIGAGSGYWAWCLAQAGADIIAVDNRPPDDAPALATAPGDTDNAWFDDEWFPVTPGDESAAGVHAERTLFLCWPDPRSYMARNALVSYRAGGGRRLIYLGDPASSGDPDFHALLDSLPCVERFRTDGWECCDEWCALYRMT